MVYSRHVNQLCVLQNFLQRRQTISQIPRTLTATKQQNLRCHVLKSIDRTSHFTHKFKILSNRRRELAERDVVRLRRPFFLLHHPLRHPIEHAARKVIQQAGSHLCAQHSGYQRSFGPVVGDFLRVAFDEGVVEAVVDEEHRFEQDGLVDLWQLLTRRETDERAAADSENEMRARSGEQGVEIVDFGLHAEILANRRVFASPAPAVDHGGVCGGEGVSEVGVAGDAFECAVDEDDGWPASYGSVGDFCAIGGDRFGAGAGGGVHLLFGDENNSIPGSVFFGVIGTRLLVSASLNTITLLDSRYDLPKNALVKQKSHGKKIGYPLCCFDCMSLYHCQNMSFYVQNFN
jgi:hypothetical protein